MAARHARPQHGGQLDCCSPRPVLGLGEGGYAYFGKQASPLGWPNGWHGPADSVHPSSIGLAYWHIPTNFGTPPPYPVTLYTSAVNEVGIYLKAIPPVLDFGRELIDPDHAPAARRTWGVPATVGLLRRPIGDDCCGNRPARQWGALCNPSEL